MVKTKNKVIVNKCLSICQHAMGIDITKQFDTDIPKFQNI